MSSISKVVIYTGHTTKSVCGPYADTVQRRIGMFHQLNACRKKMGRKAWEMITCSGEKLISTLKPLLPERTLLVIPAGQSTHLDIVFSKKDTDYLSKEFFQRGGKGYLVCGSAYWASKRRVYTDVCLVQPENPKPIEKPSKIPLFDGTSIGPLCPFPGVQYKVGFFSDAVKVTDGKKDCTVYLSGGGSFLPSKDSKQKVKVLARYKLDELKRLGKKNLNQWSNAVILSQYGTGAILMAMFHPYYGPQDIDVKRYEKAFPGCGTDWKRVHAKLSPENIRMEFVLSWIDQLENVDFSCKM